MTISNKHIKILTEMVVFHFKVLLGLMPVTGVHKNGKSQYSLGFEDGIYRIKLYILMQTSIIFPHHEFTTRCWFKKRIKHALRGREIPYQLNIRRLPLSHWGTEAEFRKFITYNRDISNVLDRQTQNQKNDTHNHMCRTNLTQ